MVVTIAAIRYDGDNSLHDYFLTFSINNFVYMPDNYVESGKSKTFDIKIITKGYVTPYTQIIVYQRLSYYLL